MRLRELQRAFVGRADGDADVILPGYTHLQRAQPVLGRPLLARLLREVRARPRAARRLPPPRESADVGIRRPGRHHDPHRSAHGRSGTRLRGHRREQPRRLGRPRLRTGIRLLPRHDRRALERLGRGMDPLVDDRVRLLEAATGVLHRFVDHAAKDEPGRARTDPRQNGPRDRQPAPRCWCW